MKPNKNLGIGVDAIPNNIKNSYILTGNDLGKLGNINILPNEEEIKKFKKNNDKISRILNTTADDKKMREELHLLAKKLLKQNKIIEAWKILLVDKLNLI